MLALKAKLRRERMKVIPIDEGAAQPVSPDYVVGQAHIQQLLNPDQGLDIAAVRFSPGARTYLHTHEGVQVLHCIQGTGILATEHQTNVVKPGMIVHVPPGELHWHGATDDSTFVHLSIRAPAATHWTKIDPRQPRES